MDTDQTYFFVATCIASVFGFILAFVINRFVNKLDKRMDQYDTMFGAMQDEISELKENNAVASNRLKHLEDTVYKVRYNK
jgi:uncharacterized membrane protein (DUF106 family)